MARDQEEAIVYKGRIRMPYNWAVGETGSFFLNKIKDDCQIWATKCSECEKVLLPPRRNCPYCFFPRTNWIQLSGNGVLTNYTKVHYHEPALHPQDPPLIYGMIKLDGADTSLLHLLGEIDEENLHEGMRLEPVFKEERTGHIKDIKYFRPGTLFHKEGS